MLELTISKEGGGEIILGVEEGGFIKYKIENGAITNTNPFEPERIVTYSLNGEKDRNTNPEKNYYPIIINHRKQEQYKLGKITEVKQLTKPHS